MTSQTDMTVTPDVPLNTTNCVSGNTGRLQAGFSLGPRQLRSRLRWMVRQVLVYGCMPLKPAFEIILKYTSPGY